MLGVILVDHAPAPTSLIHSFNQFPAMFIFSPTCSYGVHTAVWSYILYGAAVFLLLCFFSMRRRDLFRRHGLLVSFSLNVEKKKKMWLTDSKEEEKIFNNRVRKKVFVRNMCGYVCVVCDIYIYIYMSSELPPKYSGHHQQPCFTLCLHSLSHTSHFSATKNALVLLHWGKNNQDGRYKTL